VIARPESLSLDAPSVRIRAVLDANVVASALVKPTGVPGEILNILLTREGFESIVSEATLAELRRCVMYPRLRKYIKLTDDELLQWIECFAIISTVVEDEPLQELPAELEDPDDALYLAVARTGRALYIVSGDEHLSALGVYDGIEILRPRQFLTRLEDKTR
jgi:putative PIN family toxin of toxin-antitoxin system